MCYLFFPVASPPFSSAIATKLSEKQINPMSNRKKNLPLLGESLQFIKPMKSFNVLFPL